MTAMEFTAKKNEIFCSLHAFFNSHFDAYDKPMMTPMKQRLRLLRSVQDATTVYSATQPSASDSNVFSGSVVVVVVVVVVAVVVVVVVMVAVVFDSVLDD